MGMPDGVHHLAINTADIKGQIEFFTDVLGAELKALYWMHGAEKTFHGFVQLSSMSYVAFVQSDATKSIEGQIGVSHSENYSLPSAPGTMQHVAFSVASEAALLHVRDRIRSRGVTVFGPIDHGLCKSIYFAGPERLLLEVATSENAIDETMWIDPEVVELAGISAQELERYLDPEPYDERAERTPQPAIDWTKPHFGPTKSYEWLMSSPDDVIIRALSEPNPPVKPAEGRP